MAAATQVVMAFVAGMCSFSSGPWALPPGPRLPVTRKAASGYFSCIMARNGIVPPSKKTCIGLLNVARLAALSASWKALAIGGAAQFYARTIDRVEGVSLLEFGTPEAMWHLEVTDFPAIVTMDANGNSLHKDIEEASATALAAMGGR